MHLPDSITVCVRLLIADIFGGHKNPFAYNKHGLALACDGEISYNSTIARCISIYIHENNTKSNFQRKFTSTLFSNEKQ